MHNFAPVLIITLNRYNHFKRCVESLAECTHAEKTDLFIALDYPLVENYWLGYRKIVSYIDRINGFKSITLIRRNTNYGVRKNYLESMDEIFTCYDRVIFTEDDNVFSTDFLSFMNHCLDTYKNNEDIFSISGYNYPGKIPVSYPFDVYKWSGHSAWGFGIWKEKWEKLDWNEETVLGDVRKYLKNYRDVCKFNSIANNYIPAMIKMLELNRLHGDGYICLYQFINNMYSVFPTISRVRNIGHDGSGVNCGYMEDNTYREQEIYHGSGNYELPKDIKPDDEINRILYNHFRRNTKSKIKTVAKLFLINAGLLYKSRTITSI